MKTNTGNPSILSPMKTPKLILLIGIAALAATTPVRLSPVSLAADLFETGWFLGYREPDPNYQIVEAPFGPLPIQPYRVDPIPSVWFPSAWCEPCVDSNWIAPNPD